MSPRLLLALALVPVLGLATAGCSKKRRNRFESTTTGGSITSNGSGNGNGNGNGTVPPAGNLIVAVTPARGPAYGGTEVTVTGRDFVAGATITFDGRPGVDLRVVAADTILVKTPPHPAGFVDVTVTLPSGTTGTLPNGFNYEAGGPMARVADWGDPTPAEQELLELINRARRDPAAEGRRLGLDFSIYPPRPPLAHNQFLAEAGLAHTQDMAARAFFAHLNPSGVGPNGRILATAYPLNAFFGTNPAANLTESIGVGAGSRFLTPQDVHDTFMIDAGVVPPKHREVALGYGGHFPRMRETGIAYRTNLPSTAQWEHFVTEEFAFSRADRPFLLGTAWDDTTPDLVCRVGEGRSGVPVVLSHASGFQVSTTTRSAGGFAFEVLVDEEYTLTIDGQSTQVRIQGASVKVDLRSGMISRP